MILTRSLRTAAFAAGLLAMAVGVTPASADVVMSQSNDPSIRLDHNLNALLGSDRPMVKTRRTDGLGKLFRGRGRNAASTAPPSISYDRNFLSALPAVEGGEDWECLTEALYFEARGESVRGIFAVAEVIMNRVDNARFPDTVCGVVRQGTGRKYQCQFTYSCDGLAEVVHEKKAWRRVGKVAKLMIDGADRELTGGATHYHTRQVAPGWSRSFDRTATIGAHHFYSMG